MNKKQTQFILSITPLVRILLSRDQFFYYLADEKLPVGTLVSIPLFRKTVEGIVIESKNDFPRVGGITLKKIEKVLEPNFLTKEQLALAKYISDYYVISLGVVLKNFVPKRTKSRSADHVTYNMKHETKNINTIILTAEQEATVKNIAKQDIRYQIPASPAGRQNTRYLLHGPAGSGKTEVYIHSILELKKQNPQSQFLILVPEKTLTPQALERYGAYFPENEIALLSSNLSKGVYFTNWQKIKSGEAKIIIGTRMSVFAPFQKLALIVIDEEQDMSFKQWDMNPRYDARTVAEKLSELYKCKLIHGSATPSIETYFKTQYKQYKLLTLSDSYHPKNVTTQKVRSTIELVDMKKERWARNYSCISKKLKSEIAYALKNNLQSILFINRQGMSNFSVCTNCKTVLKCPLCDRALIYTNSREYKCPHCAFVASAIPNCSKCHGIEFRNVGLGTQKVEKEVRDFFPGARILRLDSTANKEKDFQKTAYEKFSRGEIDILIGTQMITKGWDLPKMSLVGVIDADNMLTLPDFRVSEKAWQDLVQLSGRVSRPGAKFPGRIIIQTYHPENKILTLIAQNNYPAFYEQELPDRKLLGYPPFGKIAKLVFEDYNQKRVAVESDRVYNLLIKEKADLKISVPTDSFVPKIRGRYRRQMLLKFQKQLPKEILIILKSLPTGWVIDIDPISII
ncbi:MAG: primosomal protein N' [Candidatus Moranbacteria bacterium]|nr:primosomal protein N' [Candidatus Moranbacteria bacterium]